METLQWLYLKVQPIYQVILLFEQKICKDQQKWYKCYQFYSSQHLTSSRSLKTIPPKNSAKSGKIICQLIGSNKSDYKIKTIFSEEKHFIWKTALNQFLNNFTTDKQYIQNTWKTVIVINEFSYLYFQVKQFWKYPLKNCTE